MVLKKQAEAFKNYETEVKTMGQKIAKVGIKKEPGYLYYVDKDGDISRAKMVRGRK